MTDSTALPRAIESIETLEDPVKAADKAIDELRKNATLTVDELQKLGEVEFAKKFWTARADAARAGKPVFDQQSDEEQERSRAAREAIGLSGGGALKKQLTDFFNDPKNGLRVQDEAAQVDAPGKVVKEAT